MKIKFLSKTADRIFKKHGWTKVEEGKIVIAYERQDHAHGYTARVEIAHHKNMPNTVCCYDTTNIKAPDYFSPSVGMDGIIMWASLLKMIGVGFLPDPKVKKSPQFTLNNIPTCPDLIKAERSGMPIHEFNKKMEGEWLKGIAEGKWEI